jgi:hypothetical protein
MRYSLTTNVLNEWAAGPDKDLHFFIFIFQMVMAVKFRKIYVSEF